MMKLHVASVPVDDQAKALAFYTDVLGFVKKNDIPMGAWRWLTVGSSDNEVELLLEPMAFAPAKVYQKALFDAGIPWTSFAVDDIHAEHHRLTGMGVSFRMGPTEMGPVKVATFEDTCGNFIQLVEKPL